MGKQPHKGRQRNWQTDPEVAALPDPATYPAKPGNVPREVHERRVLEVCHLLVNKWLPGRIKREMSRKWSAETPDYPTKPKSVNRYMTLARERLKRDYQELGGENYWPCSAAYWAARSSNPNLTDKQRVDAAKWLDTIMKWQEAQKVAITDTKGNDLGPSFLEQAAKLTSEQRQIIIQAKRIADSAAQPPAN